jgi:hypothetical protein
MISIQEYRKILGDNTSSDEQVKQRLQYLEAFCRNIIRVELKYNAKKLRKQVERHKQNRR